MSGRKVEGDAEVMKVDLVDADRESWSLWFCGPSFVSAAHPVQGLLLDDVGSSDDLSNLVFSGCRIS